MSLFLQDKQLWLLHHVPRGRVSEVGVEDVTYHKSHGPLPGTPNSHGTEPHTIPEDLPWVLLQTPGCGPRLHRGPCFLLPLTARVP